MGRNNQISSSAQRQATQLHQQSAMQAKTSTQSAPIKQQLQQQKAAAVPARPASPQSQAAQAQSKGQSQSATMKQQQRPASPQMKQQQQNPINNKNAQVYRPTPVQEHPDDAFLSGAWMFDAQRVPQWMSSQLPTAKRTLCSPKPAVVQPSSQSQSQSQSQQQMKQQQMKQPIQQPIQQQKKQQNGTVIALGSVTAKNASPDDAFFSGAWLFDAHSAPQWLTSQLPVALVTKQNQNQKKQQNQSQRRPLSPGGRRA